MDGCDGLTPWDMVAVQFDELYFCSPECAREWLEGMESAPETVTLHDPQNTVDRSQLPDVEKTTST